METLDFLNKLNDLVLYAEENNLSLSYSSDIFELVKDFEYKFSCRFEIIYQCKKIIKSDLDVHQLFNIFGLEFPDDTSAINMLHIMEKNGYLTEDIFYSILESIDNYSKIMG